MTLAESSAPTFRSLLADLRHDLKTPIGHAMGYAEMLEEDADQDTDQEFIQDLHNIQQAGERLLELINELLGPGKVHPDDIDPKDVEFRIRVELNHIEGYSEMLAEQAEEEERFADTLEDIAMIEEAVQDILTVLSDKLPPLLLADFGSVHDAPAVTTSKVDETSSGSDEADIKRVQESWHGETGEILAIDDNAGNRCCAFADFV